MFPITEEYIRRPYTIAGNQLFLTSEKSARDIEKKACKIIGLIKHVIRFMPTQTDAMSIYRCLCDTKK